MPQRKAIEAVGHLHVHLPKSLKERLDLYLYSPLEERIPHAAHQKLICQLLREFFDNATVDLGSWLGTADGISLVRGNIYTIQKLLDYLLDHTNA